MKRLPFVFALAIQASMITGGFVGEFGASGCKPAPPVPPDAPPASDVTTGTVVAELVEAGCLSPGDVEDELTSVAAEHAQHDYEWLECMYAGGSAKSCNAPCSGDP